MTASSSASACSTRSSRPSIERASRAWSASKCPVNACGQVRDLAPHPALRQLGQPQRVGLAVDHRGQHRPGRHRVQAGGDRGELDAGVFQHQLQPDRCPGSGRPSAAPGSGSASAAGGSPAAARTTGANKPVLQQLRDPFRVSTSLLRPGTAFMCAAFSSHTSITSSRQ